MTDTSTSTTVDAADVPAAHDADGARIEPTNEEPSGTELTGTAAPTPVAATATATAGVEHRPAGPTRRGRSRGRGVRKRKEPLAQASGTPPSMLVAPPAHAPTRDATVPTWTFETGVPAAGAADPKADAPGEVIAGRIDPNSPIRGSARSTPDSHPVMDYPETPGTAAPAVATSVPSTSEETTMMYQEESPRWAAQSVAYGEAASVRRPSFGPSGKHRMPFAVMVLTVFTLGLYGIVWFASVNREMGDFDPRMHVYSGRSTWAVIPPWLIGLAASAAGAGELYATRVAHVKPPVVIEARLAAVLACGLLVIPYLVLIFPFSIVAAVMTLERLRVAEDHVGMAGDVHVRPARTLARLLFPVFGGLSAMAHGQRRLNEVWDLVATDEHRGQSWN